MKRSIAAASVPLCLTAAFGLGHIHPFGDPRVEPAKGRGMILRDASIPAAAKAVLINKCADCHSAETRWPVYSRLAPGSWLIERDIVEARRHMDLSKWEELAPDRREVLLAEIVQQARTGNMPPIQYRLLHWDSKLSRQDMDALAYLRKRPVPTDTAQTGLGDPVRGRAVFEKRCTGCHAMDANREGPRLARVYGRKAGSDPDFSYSAGLKNSRWLWNDTTLDKWLTDPDMMVPGNNMSIAVPKAAERRDLIAYFKDYLKY